MAKEIVHNTYVITKPPVKDDAKRTITFNFTTYRIPIEGGNLFQNLYNQLTEAVESEENDLGVLLDVLVQLKPYAVFTRVNPSRKPTAIYDPIEGRVIEE